MSDSLFMYVVCLRVRRLSMILKLLHKAILRERAQGNLPSAPCAHTPSSTHLELSQQMRSWSTSCSRRSKRDCHPMFLCLGHSIWWLPLVLQLSWWLRYPCESVQGHHWGQSRWFHPWQRDWTQRFGAAMTWDKLVEGSYQWPAVTLESTARTNNYEKWCVNCLDRHTCNRWVSLWNMTWKTAIPWSL